RYVLKYLKIFPEDIKYEMKKEENNANEESSPDKKRTYQATQNNIPKSPMPNEMKNVKVLDKFAPGKKDEHQPKFKKYSFPVKKFNKESKVYNPTDVFKKIEND